jgi:flavin-dependent dehydrogenase
MYDAIVIGARCAGAPTAMNLARKGYRVLLADRATFPRDIPHGHLIHKDGPRRLAKWGLLDAVARDAPAITSMTLDLGDFPLVGRGLILDDIAFAYGPRRSTLDKILVDAAVQAGAELREGFTIEDFLGDGQRLAGIRGRHRSGSVVEERARITIGADGRYSRLAAAVGAPVYDAFPTATCWYFSYWSGVSQDGLEVYVLPDRMIFAFPTSDGLYAIFVAWPIASLQQVRADIEGQFMSTIDTVPRLATRVRAGRREEPFRGATDLPNYFRKPYGAGWALVGDAGCHKDPYLALGICDAFRDVDALVDAVDSGLSGRSNLDAALEQYEQQRNRTTRDEYFQNLSGARFERPPDDFFRLRAALRTDAEATREFFLAREGMIARERFFNPENLARLFAAPLQR